MEKRIIKIDASSLVKSSCWLRFKRIVVDGYKEKVPWNDTQYGSAFHKFISTMYLSEGNIAIATDAALNLFHRPCNIRNGKEHLNDHHLLKSCFDYWEHFKKTDNFEVFSIDGKPLVEIDFSIPFYENDLFIVMLEGTIDKIGQIKNGVFSIGDYKTHSLWSMYKNGKNKNAVDLAIKKYFSQYEMSVQLSFYLFCLKLKAKQNPDSQFSQMCLNKNFAAFIDGVFLSSSEDTLFRRSDVMIRKPEFFEMFERQLRLRIQNFISVLTLNPDYEEQDGLLCGACNDGKFPCDFLKVCAAPDSVARNFLLKSQYIQKPYNPLEFSK